MQPGHKHVRIQSAKYICGCPGHGIPEMSYGRFGPTYNYHLTGAELAAKAARDLASASAAAELAAQKLRANPDAWLHAHNYEEVETFPWDASLAEKQGWWGRENQWKQAKQQAQHAEAQIVPTGYLMPRFAYH